MLIGLAAYSRIYHIENGGEAGWSYSAGWMAFALAIICSVCFVMVALYTKRPSRLLRHQEQVYTPLAQFEASTTSDDDDV